MSEYNVEELLGELDIDKEIEEAEDVKTCKVTIDGKEYTFETAAVSYTHLRAHET